MENEINQATLDLNDALIKIKSEIDSLKEVAVVSSETEREQILSKYQTNVLPHLLQLRRLNRTSKDKLETKHDKVRELNRKLDNLHDYWENIVFEASCLNSDVEQAKKRLSPTKAPRVNPTPPNGGMVSRIEHRMSNGHSGDHQSIEFDAEQVALLDHQKRLSLLDEEEQKRKALQDRLADVSKETSEIEVLCHASETELNRIKPFIRQLVDKVEPMNASTTTS